MAGHDYGRIQWHTADTSMPGTDDIGAEIRAYDDSDTYGDRAALLFSTAHNATSLTERMRIGSDGYVGIGTTAPAEKLHVYIAGNDIPLRIQTDSHVGMEIKGGTAHDIYFLLADTSTNAKMGWDHSATALKFNASASFNDNHLVVKSTGVGIGTDAPTANFKLDVEGDLMLGETSGTDNSIIDQKQNGSLYLINSGASSNEGRIGINKWNTIAGGTTLFRDFIVYDGKNSAILTVDGSAAGVGIGTVEPGFKLQVDESTATAYAASIRNTGANLQLKLGTTTGALLNIQGSTINTDAAYDIALQADGGKVGIGTASPAQKLEVNGGSSAVQIQFKETSTGYHRVGLKKDGSKFHIGEPSNDGTTSFTEILTVDLNGDKVGIGTTAPANTLHVNGQTRLGSWAKIMHTGDSTQAGYIGSGADLAFGDSNDLCLRGTDSIKFTTNDGQSDAMTIDVNGKVGIGTAAPGEKLTVWNSNISLGKRQNSVTSYIGKGTGTNGQTFGSNSNWIAFASDGTDDWITFGTHESGVGGGERVRIAPSGNVGIGTDAPSSKLTVLGTSTAASVTPANAIVDIAGTSTAHLLMGVASVSPYGAWINTDATSQPLILMGAGGNVGIGTTAPEAPLVVAGSGGNEAVFRSNQATATERAGGGFSSLGSATATSRYARLFLDADGANFGGTDYFAIEKFGNSGEVKLLQYSNANMSFWVNTSTQAMTIKNDGKVGIGTTAPYGGLHVNASNYGESPTINKALLVSDSADATKYLILTYHASADVGIIQGLDDSLAWKNVAINPNGGNVGIGLTVPLYRLQVMPSTSGGASSNASEHAAYFGGNELGGIGGYTGIRLGGFGSSGYGTYIRSVKTSAYGGYWNEAITFNVTRAGTANVIDEIMRIAADGNVGIGTTAPANLLHLYRSGNDSIPELMVHSVTTSTTVDYYKYAIVGKADGAHASWSRGFGVVGLADAAQFHRAVGVYASLDLNLPSGVSYDSALFADGKDIGYAGTFMGGNVGIGTNAPATPLHVRKIGNPSSGGNRNTVEEVLTLDATGYYPYTGYGVGISFKGEDYGNTAIRQYAKIQSVMTGHSAQTPAGDPSFKSALTFWTNTGGASGTLATEKVRIDADGNVGIGTTNPGAYKLFVNGTTNLNGALTGTSATFSGNVKLPTLPSTTANAAVPILFRPTEGTLSGDTALTWNPAADSLDVNGTVICF